MSEFGFKYFFKVVDLYVIEGRLVAVSDITDSGDYMPGEVVELHRPDGSILTGERTLAELSSASGCPIPQ